MKSFKEFSKDVLPILSWGGHESIRDKVKKVLPMLSWGGHETIRDKLKPENVKESFEGWGHGGNYDSSFHNHPDIKTQALTSDHLRSIVDYTAISSSDQEHGHRSSHNMNNLLRNMGGDKTVGVKHHDATKVLDAVKELSSAFTPENTNRKEVRVHCGIPEHIGKSLLRGVNHHIAGFLSTSSDHKVARDFAATYARENNNPDTHVLTLKAQPGSIMSIAPQSQYQRENEALAHHGARISGVKSTTQPNSYGGTQYNYEATLHADHKPLHEYGEYHDPSHESQPKFDL